MTNQQNSMTATLLDWLEGRLTAASADTLAARVQADPILQEEVAWLREFLQISQKTVLVDPPADVQQHARTAFAAYAKTKRPPGLLQTFLAVLTADNWQRPALAGVRHLSLRSEPRQLVYHSDLADIALTARMETPEGLIDLSGQVFPLDDSDPADFLIQLFADASGDPPADRLTECDGLGKFRLTGMASGRYHLFLSSDQGKIEIGPIELE